MKTLDRSRRDTSQFGRRIARTAGIGLVWLWAALWGHGANAATLTVTNLNDSGTGSFRDRIAVANNGDTINFAVSGEVSLTDRLTINKSLTIQGSASRSVTISSPQCVNHGITISAGSAGSVTIADLKFRNGGLSAPGITSGTRVTLQRCEFTDINDWAVRNAGTTEMYYCEIINAGVLNTGSLTMYASSVSGAENRYCNSMESGLENSGNATLTNCTFASNHLAGVAGVLELKSCTLSTCSMNAIDGGIYLQNTIIAGYSPLQVTGSGGIISQGYNLCEGSGNGFLVNARDQTSVAARLEPISSEFSLAFQPGPGSAAIDHGFAPGLALDQLARSRRNDLPYYPNGPGSDTADIGAVEGYEYAQGYNYVVNFSSDTNDGVCGYYHCTLREAVAASNTDGSQYSTIAFRPEIVGTIGLTQTNGPLTINAPVKIIGPGARDLAISGSASMRVFNISGTGHSDISGLTIRDGITYSTQFSAATGGAVNNSADITFTDCAFVFSFAFGRDGASGGGLGGFAWGGAIYNSGVLNFDRCLFNGNGADGGLGGGNTGTGAGGAGGIANGGAVYNDVNATLTLTNCTLFNNTASGGNGGSNSGGRGGAGGTAKGAGIFNRGTMTLTACTLKGNNGAGGTGGQGSSAPNNGTAGTGAGGVTSDPGSSSTLRNTLVAGNTGNGGVDCNGAFLTGGYNLIAIADYATGLNAPTDQRGTTAAPIDPKLDTLKNNGGPTDTLALLTNSPAIDQGNSFDLTKDQRSRSRPLDNANAASASGGDGSDIGAFESAGLIKPKSLVSRKYAGNQPFDVDLMFGSANSGIECRSGGATNDHQLVMTFPFPVQVNGSPRVSVTTGSAQVGSNGQPNNAAVTVNGSIVTIPLTNVTNAQAITISVNGVSDDVSSNSITANIRFLLGDTNGDGTVNSADIAQTKSKSGQAVNTTNFRNDVNADGTLNSADIALVKSKSGTAIP